MCIIYYVYSNFKTCAILFQAINVFVLLLLKVHTKTSVKRKKGVYNKRISFFPKRLHRTDTMLLLFYFLHA